MPDNATDKVVPATTADTTSSTKKVETKPKASKPVAAKTSVKASTAKDVHPGYKPRGRKVAAKTDAKTEEKKSTYPNPISKGEDTVKVTSKVRYMFTKLGVCLEAGKPTVVARRRWEMALTKVPRLKKSIELGVIKVG